MKKIGWLMFGLGVAGIVLVIVNFTVDNILDGFVFLPAFVSLFFVAVGWQLARQG